MKLPRLARWHETAGILHCFLPLLDIGLASAETTASLVSSLLTLLNWGGSVCLFALLR